MENDSREKILDYRRKLSKNKTFKTLHNNSMESFSINSSFEYKCIFIYIYTQR